MRVPDPCNPPSLEEAVKQTQREIGGVMFTRIDRMADPFVKGITYKGRYKDICYYLEYGPFPELPSDPIKGVSYDEGKLQRDIPLFEHIVSTFTILEIRN
jgi:hypothetical protein